MKGEEMSITYKIRHKHKKNCAAKKAYEKKVWDFAWSEFPIGTFFGDSIGRRRNGHTIWLVFQCNSINCPLRLLVKAADIFTYLPKF